MATAAEALQARQIGDKDQAQLLFQSAMKLEWEASKHVPRGSQPTKSVLLRSAASLELQAGLLEDVEVLCTLGLLGSPPREIVVEIWEVRKLARRARKEARFKRENMHLMIEAIRSEVEIEYREALQSGANFKALRIKVRGQLTIVHSVSLYRMLTIVAKLSKMLKPGE